MKRLVEIKSIGPIPWDGDNYWDGIIDAHNDKYFITRLTEVCYAHEHPAYANDPCKDPMECECRAYETFYYVYPMDETLRILLDTKSDKVNYLLSCATWYAENMKEPIGFIREGNLERV